MPMTPQIEAKDIVNDMERSKYNKTGESLGPLSPTGHLKRFSMIHVAKDRLTYEYAALAITK